MRRRPPAKAWVQTDSRISRSLRHTVQFAKGPRGTLSECWLHDQTASQGPFPPINVFQQEDDILAIIELPGVEKDSLQVQAKQNTIRIAGKKAISYPEGASVIGENVHSVNSIHAVAPRPARSRSYQSRISGRHPRPALTAVGARRVELCSGVGTIRGSQTLTFLCDLVSVTVEGALCSGSERLRGSQTLTFFCDLATVMSDEERIPLAFRICNTIDRRRWMSRGIVALEDLTTYHAHPPDGQYGGFVLLRGYVPVI